MIEVVVPLAGARGRSDAIRTVSMASSVALVPHPDLPGGLIALLDGKAPIGHLTARHAIARRVSEGQVILHASVNSVSMPAEDWPGEIRLRIATGEAGERYAVAELSPPRTYKVGIVGERNYQPAIRASRAGEAVGIFHESDNPYGKKALAVVAASGLIGYIGRDHWLQAAIHDEEQGCTATIVSIASGSGGELGVVLDVALCAGPIARRSHADAVASAVRAAGPPAQAISAAPATPIVHPLAGDRHAVDGWEKRLQQVLYAIGALAMLVLLGRMVAG